ncbi:MAG: ABC transporter ATP-binding protein, partial [Hyphomicrobiales bacterium]
MTALLTVRDLRVGFGKRPEANEVVKGVSFDLAAGETLAIVGESGSGKSVTALSVNRLVDFGGGRITNGSIILQRSDGSTLDVARADEKVLRTIRGRDVGMIFQEPMTSLNPVLTIGRQLSEAITAHESLDANEVKARALHLLDQVQIPQAARRLTQHPHELSGGMRQRV